MADCLRLELSLHKTMKTAVFQSYRGFLSLALLAIGTVSIHAQALVVTNYTFDTPASASPPAWGVWPNGIDNYVTNTWSSSDVSNNPNSGSLLITSTFTGANEQRRLERPGRRLQPAAERFANN
jgi:hypothetical protein